MSVTGIPMPARPRTSTTSPRVSALDWRYPSGEADLSTRTSCHLDDLAVEELQTGVIAEEAHRTHAIPLLNGEGVANGHGADATSAQWQIGTGEC